MSKHQVVCHQVTQVWRGPVPDPATLIEFEKILLQLAAIDDSNPRVIDYRA